jgi:dipeptide/tripeptide permease
MRHLVDVNPLDTWILPPPHVCKVLCVVLLYFLFLVCSAFQVKPQVTWNGVECPLVLRIRTSTLERKRKKESCRRTEKRRMFTFVCLMG